MAQASYADFLDKKRSHIVQLLCLASMACIIGGQQHSAIVQAGGLRRTVYVDSRSSQSSRK